MRRYLATRCIWWWRMLPQPKPRMEKYLADNGITVSRVEKIRPSLEDVFVSLTTAGNAGEERRA